VKHESAQSTLTAIALVPSYCGICTRAKQASVGFAMPTILGALIDARNNIVSA